MESFLDSIEPGMGAFRYTTTAQAADTSIGGLTTELAETLGLRPGLTIAAGAFDAHTGAVGAGVAEGVLVKIIGTSTCDTTVVPGDREVVHHILAGSIDADTRRPGGVFDNYLIGYAPGNESHTFPEGTGVYIPPGGKFSFQLHYTPIGRETVDRSRIGLYFLAYDGGSYVRNERPWGSD